MTSIGRMDEYDLVRTNPGGCITTDVEPTKEYDLVRMNSSQLLFSRTDGQPLGECGTKYLDAYYDLLSTFTSIDNENLFWLVSNVTVGVTTDGKSVVLMEASLKDKPANNVVKSKKYDNFESIDYYVYRHDGDTNTPEKISEILLGIIDQNGADEVIETKLEKFCCGKYLRITITRAINKDFPFQRGYFQPKNEQ